MSSILSHNNIDHDYMAGVVCYGKTVIIPHAWLIIDDFIVDYRLKKWIGDLDHCPHGIFMKNIANNKKIYYFGEKQELSCLSVNEIKELI